MKIITLKATDDRECFSQNTHEVIIKSEDDDNFVGWPNPKDSRNSDKWNPDSDKPLTYPKFAWKVV